MRGFDPESFMMVNLATQFDDALSFGFRVKRSSRAKQSMKYTAVYNMRYTDILYFHIFSIPYTTYNTLYNIHIYIYTYTMYYYNVVCAMYQVLYTIYYILYYIL